MTIGKVPAVVGVATKTYRKQGAENVMFDYGAIGQFVYKSDGIRILDRFGTHLFESFITTGSEKKETRWWDLIR